MNLTERLIELRDAANQDAADSRAKATECRANEDWTMAGFHSGLAAQATYMANALDGAIRAYGQKGGAA